MLLTIREHRPEDLPLVVAREGAVYRELFGWNEEFGALVAGIVAEFARTSNPACEQAWIAELHGAEPGELDARDAERLAAHAGHVFLVRHPERPRTAKLRLLLVEPAAQGHGVGRALVRTCLAFARERGYATVVLWTQSMLRPAIRIYASEGFRLVHEEPHHSFGADLVAQTWELEL